MTKIKTLENEVAAAALELASEYKRNGCKYEFAGEDDYPDDLWGITFPGRPVERRETLKRHIHQINDPLAATDWRIRSAEQQYRLMKGD